MQHHLWYIALWDQLFLSPIIENPQNVLDIGTGTGIWAIDFGVLTLLAFCIEYC